MKMIADGFEALSNSTWVEQEKGDLRIESQLTLFRRLGSIEASVFANILKLKISTLLETI